MEEDINPEFIKIPDREFILARLKFLKVWLQTLETQKQNLEVKLYLADSNNSPLSSLITSGIREMGYRNTEEVEKEIARLELHIAEVKKNREELENFLKLDF